MLSTRSTCFVGVISFQRQQLLLTRILLQQCKLSSLTFTLFEYHPFYVTAWRRQLRKVGKDRIVLIFIFLLCMSVKANSFQEMCVLKPDVVLEVVRVSMLPFVFILTLPCSQRPMSQCHSTGKSFLLGLHDARVTSHGYDLAFANS